MEDWLADWMIACLLCRDGARRERERERESGNETEMVSWPSTVLRGSPIAREPTFSRARGLADEHIRECSGQGDLSSSCVVSIWRQVVLVVPQEAEKLGFSYVCKGVSWAR